MYLTGALKNPVDYRDIKLARVQAPVPTPPIYKTDISFIPVLYQGVYGSCVGHSHAIIHAYNEWFESGSVRKFSPRYLYALSKKLDGNPNQGTYPRVCAKVMMDKGCATEATVPNDVNLPYETYINVSETVANPDALPYRIKGYAEPSPDHESIKQAIFQNKLVTVTLPVGDWTKPQVKPGDINNLHRVTLYGYDHTGEDLKLFFRNSWGENWGDKGNGWFNYSDFEGKIFDLQTYTDIPNSILEEIKGQYQYFKPTEIVGLKPELVTLLDKARGIAGIPFIITSGLRTPAKNLSVGGKPNSAHLTGEAVDLKCSDSVSRWKILNALLKVGFNRIEVARNHIHCDISKTLPQNIFDFSSLA